MLKVAYLEDEQIQREYLVDLLKDRKDVDVVLFSSAKEMMFKCDEQFDFDLIILDIQMPEINGMEMAHYIRKFNKKVAIIFLTAVKDYVFEGYEVRAIQYLIKPITKEKLDPILDEITSNQKNYLIIHQKRYLLDNLIYIMSDGHYVDLVFENETISEKIGINQLKQQLPQHFVETHRSYMVNISFVEEINRTYLVASGKEIPISRGQYNQVNQTFIAYHTGKIL